ncbi:hypothetical protein [Azotobacter chroococcum]|uniref:Uncharacterized protein n=1 Tax=Azotobacter chroococcum NCIMB 8003 TaxID=1328314 RepID=A0A0C4WTX8_9GAMM|nr:hypothetical protein [Azotobacter chroococcum]AJE23150.1 Hypothetical protein Achr_37620 [Azotobacter chroococcum NCIMB 8003]
MTTYTGHRVEDHEDFILEQLLPLIVDYAGASDTPTEVVTFAVFLTLATILQAKGLSRDVLVRAIDAARLQTHEALESVQ